MDLVDLVTYHQLTLQSEGRTKATQRQYLYFHRVFLDWLHDSGIDPQLDALTPANLRQCVLWYQRQPDRRRTRNGEVATRALVDLVKRLGSFGEEEGIYPVNPLARVKRPRVTEHLPEPFTTAELNALWAATQRTQDPARDEALFLLLLDTGMRIGEATTLTLDRLRLDGEDRHVRVGARGKGRRERIAPLGDVSKRDGGRTVRALRRYVAEAKRTSRGGGHVFLARDGYPLTASGGNHLLHRLGEMAGVEDSHPHRTRHCFCTNFLTEHPGDEMGLRRIVGHLAKETLARYVHLAQSTIAQRAARASLAERLTGVSAAPVRRRAG